VQQTESWYDQDGFWQDVEPVLFDQRRWSDAPAEVDKIVTLLGLQVGMTVLDLCCGVGRHSLEFARRGFHVTGLDRTRAYLEQAARQASAESLAIDWIHQDMRTWRRPETFDAVVNLFTSFGYFEDQEQDREVVRNVYHSLKAGGAFLIDVMGKEILARIFQERDWHEEDGTLVLQERKVSKAWSWMENRWILIQGGHRIEHKLSHRIYSAAELMTLLIDCGFARAEAYGDFTGNAYDLTASRLVVIARK
jgi:SAM-dependent methyltransferase